MKSSMADVMMKINKKQELSSIKPELLTSNLDFKVTEDSFVIDKTSLKLLKQGVPNQKYVSLDYVHPNEKKIYRFYVPTVIAPPEPGEIETKEEKALRKVSEDIATRSGFTAADLALAPNPLQSSVTGIVHRNARQLLKDKFKNTPTISILKAPKVGAGSVKKLENGYFLQLGRSQNNRSLFTLNEIFLVTSNYRGQTSLEFDGVWTQGQHIARSQPWEYVNAGRIAMEKSLELSDGAEKDKTTAESLLECYPEVEEKISSEEEERWIDFLELSNKDKFTYLTENMHFTLYVACGLKVVDEFKYDLEVFTEILNSAKKYGIPLNFEHIPAEIKDNEDATALIQTTKTGKHEILALLLEEKVNLQAKDREGYSALDYAFLNRDEKAFELLIKKIKTCKDMSFNIVSSDRDNLEVYMKFLKQFADFGIYSVKEKETNNTLLHTAVLQGKKKMNIVSLILAHDPKLIYEKNAEGKTAFDYAVETNNIFALKEMAPHLERRDLEYLEKNEKIDSRIKTLAAELLSTRSYARATKSGLS